MKKKKIKREEKKLKKCSLLSLTFRIERLSRLRSKSRETTNKELECKGGKIHFKDEISSPLFSRLRLFQQ
jgi:hypothetical protein